MNNNHLTFSLMCLNSIGAKLSDDSNGVRKETYINFERINSCFDELATLFDEHVLGISHIESVKGGHFYFFESADLFALINLCLNRVQQRVYVEPILYNDAVKVINKIRFELDLLQNILHNSPSTSCKYI